jgi:hypothetical protein
MTELAAQLIKLDTERREAIAKICSGTPSGDPIIDFTVTQLGDFRPGTIAHYRKIDAQLQAVPAGELILLCHCWYAKTRAGSHSFGSRAMTELILGVASGQGFIFTGGNCHLPTSRWVHYRNWNELGDGRDSTRAGDCPFNLDLPESERYEFAKMEPWDWELPLERTLSVTWQTDALNLDLGWMWPVTPRWLTLVYSTEAVIAWLIEEAIDLAMTMGSDRGEPARLRRLFDQMGVNYPSELAQYEH